MTFAERLKALRTERGMSLEEVGNDVGVGRATIYKYESGAISNIPPERIHQLANLFGVTRPYLMGWTEEREINPDANLDVVAERLRKPTWNQCDGLEVWKPAKSIDCITAATQALRALAKFRIAGTPVYPQQILQASSLASIVTFDSPKKTRLNDEEMVVSSVKKWPDGNPHYVFSVNRNAPIGELSLILAIHIGHIYLGHAGGTRECGKRQESECFAVHLRYPRPMIRLLEERGFVFTKESFSMVFGYCDPCLNSILNAHPVRTSPDLNRLVKEQFTPYADLLEKMGVLKEKTGGDALDLSKYMAGYEE